MRDDDDLDLDAEDLDLDLDAEDPLPEPLPPASGFDDGELSRRDLTRPLGGYPISDEEDRAEHRRVYSEEGDVYVEGYQTYMEQQRERDPPR